MKNIKKQVLTALLCASVALSCAPSYSIFADSKDNNEIAAFDTQYSNLCKDCLYVDGADKINSKGDAIKWRKNGRDNKYYLYLPSGVNINKLKIYSTFDEDVTIDGKKIESGKETDIFASKKDLTLKAGDKTYEVVVMQGDTPSMFITTDNNDLNYFIEDKNNSDSGRVLITNADGSVDCECTVSKFKGRGNSTWLKDKKPFALSLDKKAKLLGMDASKKYVLLANYNDMSLLHNKVAYDLSHEVGIDYSPASKQVNLYVNGEYQGVYDLCEKVEVGKNNLVKITDLEEKTEKVNEKKLEKYGQAGEVSCIKGTNKYYNIPNNPDDITGGYLLEYEIQSRYKEEPCGFVTSHGQSIICKGPEYASKEQMDYISSFYQDFEDALYSEDGYNLKGKHYTDYIDSESFAKMYFIQELSKNIDIGLTSLYMYKDSDLVGDGKLHMAASWDFDTAFGIYKDSENDGSGATGLIGPNSCILGEGDKFTDTPTIFNSLLKHEDYVDCVVNEWKNNFSNKAKMIIKDKTFNTERLKSLKEYSESMKASADMNFSRWDILGYNITGIDTGSTYSENVNFLFNYLKDRITYLDDVYGKNNGKATPEEKVDDFKVVKVYFDNSESKWDDVYVNLYYCYGEVPFDTTRKMEKVEGSDNLYYTEVSTKYDGLFFRTGDFSGTSNFMLKVPLNNKNCYKQYATEDFPDGGWFEFNGKEPESKKLNLTSKLRTWNVGYQIDLEIKNSSNKTANGWAIKVKKGDLNINNFWNVNVKEDGDHLIITPLNWNESIDAGKSVEFGLIGAGEDIERVTFDYELIEN